MARIVPLGSVKFSLNKSENIFVGFNESLETEKLGIYYARLMPGQKLKRHMHNRPENGDEIFFFFKPCRIKLGFERDCGFTEEILNIKEPTHILIDPKEHHSIENVGDCDVVFEVICAPKFKEGEVTIMERVL